MPNLGKSNHLLEQGTPVYHILDTVDLLLNSNNYIDLPLINYPSKQKQLILKDFIVMKGPMLKLSAIFSFTGFFSSHNGVQKIHINLIFTYGQVRVGSPGSPFP